MPPTEKRGRVHTSTVTVAVLAPGRNPMTTEIPEKDLRVEWFSGTGKGGQHRNKHQNCCRLIHVPTGLVQTAVGRERRTNYEEAYRALARRLRQHQAEAVNAAHNAARCRLIGSGERGDKIRTYRAQDDRVTDHRTGRTARYETVMRGGFDALIR